MIKIIVSSNPIISRVILIHPLYSPIMEQKPIIMIFMTSKKFKFIIPISINT
ncbi:hypothetical protein [Rickettsia endosymbiont of Cardiosporidium cionae]|uniref:hypothetical protein n=1 Tax=Rickettsia endosymbiont of Cardiosporidium cionae TaxID=2777155 RepID=UPI001E3DD457|nr:hypothetical protein [Rickettsia endosymbiont of Cardiosporidium cionae]